MCSNDHSSVSGPPCESNGKDGRDHHVCNLVVRLLVTFVPLVMTGTSDSDVSKERAEDKHSCQATSSNNSQNLRGKTGKAHLFQTRNVSPYLCNHFPCSKSS